MEEQEVTTLEEQQTPEVSQETTTEDAQQQGTEAQQPVEDVWDGKPFALKFRGREIIPESKEKLINLAQLGHTYSTKLNDLQTRENTLSERLKAVEQYEQLSKAFESNPAFKQQILNMYYQSQNGGQAADQEVNGSQQPNVDPKLLEQVNSLSQWREQYEQSRADEDLKSEISQLVSSNPGFDWKTTDEEGKTLVHDVLQKAHELGGVPLEVAFRAVAWDQMREQAAAEALKNNAAAKEANAAKGKAVSPQPSQPAPAKPAKDSRSMSYDEIARDVIANLKK